MSNLARGYIASGSFNGNRMPQHLQNQIVKLYCDTHNFEFVLSRAEYWINGGTQCQLWAALKEGFKNIVFFSVWQMPNDKYDRKKIYEFCLKEKIVLHFATEHIHAELHESCFADLEILIDTNSILNKSIHHDSYFGVLKELM